MTDRSKRFFGGRHKEGGRAYNADNDSVPCADRNDVASLSMNAEFVAVGGSEGEALEAGQLAIVREIIKWLHQHANPQASAPEIDKATPER